MPLNHQLVDLEARLVTTTSTADTYRLFDLGLTPPKPGLVRDERGASIEVEVWSMAVEAFGRFVAAVPPPLAIGTVELADGSSVPGFVCEPYAVAGATEITEWGGWRAFQEHARRVRS
jgi:allophanate hydrolase